MQNASLQKESMVSALGSCLRHAEDFQEILKDANSATGRFKRLQNSLTTFVKEKRFMELCLSLEREKSSLSLCIAEIDS